MFKTITALLFCLSTTNALAMPQSFTTRNYTDVESNVYIGGGKVPSPYPTDAHSTNLVGWNMVRIGCVKHTTNGKCKAMLKMATDTNNPIEIGMLSLDLDSGDVTPKAMSANGYTATVTGVAEITLTKN